jgi:hypothetical protein
MRKVSVLFVLFLVSLNIYGKEDSLFIKIIGDTVQVWNTEISANCASKFTSSIMFLDSNRIVITECDTVGPIAKCMCYFDLYSSVTGLTSGQYTVSVYRQELEKYFYLRDTIIFIGELTFTLENSSLLDASALLTQSECYYPTEQTFTAQHWFANASTACQVMRNGAKLRRVYSEDVSFDGKATKWNYKFSWFDQPNDRLELLYFHNEQDQVLFDSISLEMELGTSYITQEWFDSDSALSFAEVSGGKTFREENPDYTIRASVSEALVPYSYPVWYITYSSLTDINKKFSIHFDARRNASLMLTFSPEVDTLFLLGGCTVPEMSFHLGGYGTADAISMEAGFNTSFMTKDSLGNYIPVGRCLFFVIPSNENYEYELWYHPKSYPAFDPILIPFDSAFYSEQSFFEIQLIVKLQGIPVDSLSQLFKAQYGLDVEPDDIFPQEFALLQNYPNPFNPNTNFEFHIPQSEFVSLKVFDVLGRAVVTLISEEKPAGIYKVEFNAEQLSSGVYFYSINAGNFSSTKKLILLK